MKEKIIIGTLAILLIASLFIYQEREASYENYVETSTEYINGLENQIETMSNIIEAHKEFKEINKRKIANLLQFIRLTSDYQEMLRATEAEARGQEYEGKLYVAAVIENRAIHEKFGNTIHDVIYAPGQFDVVEDGSINRVVATDETVQAVEDAIVFNHITEALYFMDPKLSGETSRNWMRTLEHVVTVKDHEFYK